MTKDKKLSDFEFENKVNSLIRFGKSWEDIAKALKGQTKRDYKVLQNQVKIACEDFPDYYWIQKFVNSKIIFDKDSEDDKIYLYDDRDRTVENIAQNRMLAMIDPKLKWHHKRYTCSFEYNPRVPFKIAKRDNFWYFNTYKPPKWLEDYFYDEAKKPIKKVGEVPKLYHDFLEYLVDGDSESYNYILDWIANSIHTKNLTYLTTIGTQGIGKGILGEIIGLIHGESNYYKEDKRIISGNFNGQMADKTFLYLDEFEIKSVDQENKTKDLVNKRISLEKKGVDARMVINYCNVYISSNNLDSIRISPDDRRFSLINLTDIPMTKAYPNRDIKSYTDILYKPENITEFAQYLYHRDYDKARMLKVFKSNRTMAVKYAGLMQWQQWFFENYVPDKVGKGPVLLEEVGQLVYENCNSLKAAVGRTKFQKLSKMYEGVFRAFSKRENDKKKWYIEVYRELTDEEL